MIFTDSLLSICGELLDGREVTVEEKKWHLGTESLLFGRNSDNFRYLRWFVRWLPFTLKVWMSVLEEVIHDTVSSKKPIPLHCVPRKERSTHFIPFKFESRITTAFLNACRENNVTFNSGFTAACCLALQRSWNLSKGDKLVVIIPAKMRDYCRPKLGDAELAFAVSSIHTDLHLKSNVDEGRSTNILWDMAKVIQKDVHGEEAKKKLVRECYKWCYLQAAGSLTENYFITNTDCSRLGHLLISNLGRVRCPSRFGSHLTLDGWYAIDRERTLGSFVSHFLATVGSECCITTQWTYPLLDDLDMERYQHELLNVIDHVCRVSGQGVVSNPQPTK
eukprot:TRINITY_DN1884_c0_g1_i2.p1 TRINITY_DN1884_c0_g1~~TRINITY_DN1884_c0_g1_i2.p1  ORF type:complete len:334 (-),score=55.03 TRINITY_DN1884_c0_g1_i2:98-1099(-)